MATNIGKVQATQSVNPDQKWWVDLAGNFMLSTVGDLSMVQPGWIEVPSGPDYWDQIWDHASQSWGPSTYAATQIEDAWREAEMAVIADQLLMIEDEDPNVLPGTAAQWRAYRIQVRAWKTGNANFPFGARPVRPAA